MTHYAEERCTQCKLICSKILLTAKRIQFTEVTNHKKILKSRVVAWLCEKCRNADPDWQLEPREAAPGLKSPALERVRAAQRQEKK